MPLALCTNCRLPAAPSAIRCSHCGFAARLERFARSVPVLATAAALVVGAVALARR